VVSQTKPFYPKAAFERKVEGEVVVGLLISEEGRVVHAEVQKSVPGLDAAALSCVRQWVFTPALRDGRPVPTFAIAPVSFRIF
jgi:protein TonB